MTAPRRIVSVKCQSVICFNFELPDGALDYINNGQIVEMIGCYLDRYCPEEGFNCDNILRNDEENLYSAKLFPEGRGFLELDSDSSSCNWFDRNKIRITSHSTFGD